jgi:hypothetical protein
MGRHYERLKNSTPSCSGNHSSCFLKLVDSVGPIPRALNEQRRMAASCAFSKTLYTAKEVTVVLITSSVMMIENVFYVELISIEAMMTPSNLGIAALLHRYRFIMLAVQKDLEVIL